METIKNKFKSNPGCNTMHPNLLWCKMMRAIEIWPVEHDGQFLKKGEYSNMLDKKPYKYQSTLENLRLVGYILYISKKKDGNYGYTLTDLGKQVLQQIKEEFGEENLLIF